MMVAKYNKQELFQPHLNVSDNSNYADNIS